MDGFLFDVNRIERIAGAVTAAFNRYDNMPKPWGDNGGLLYKGKSLVVYPENGKWNLMEYRPYGDSDTVSALENHVLPHGERNVRRDFLGIRKSYQSFSDDSALSEFMKSEYGIEFSTRTGFDLYGMSIYNISDGKMTDDDIRKVLKRCMAIMGKAIGFENVDRYLPGAIAFENQRMDFDERVGWKAQAAGVNVDCGRILPIDANAKYDDMIRTIIHEVGHDITVRNKNVMQLMRWKFKEYSGKHSDVISFRRGDMVTFDMGGNEVVYKAIDDFSPSFERGEYNDARMVKVKGDGMNTIHYKSFLGTRIVRIEHVNGAVSENNLGISPYALVNAEEFVAELFAHYCMKTLPKKLRVFMENEVIPLL